LNKRDFDRTLEVASFNHVLHLITNVMINVLVNANLHGNLELKGYGSIHAFTECSNFISRKQQNTIFATTNFVEYQVDRL